MIKVRNTSTKVVKDVMSEIEVSLLVATGEWELYHEEVKKDDSLIYNNNSIDDKDVININDKFK